MGEANETQDKLDQAKFAFRDHEPTNFFQIYSADQINLKQTQVFDLTMRPPDIVDLNLRLSLGGIYNTGNYTKEKPLTLTRSSSIAGEVTLRKTPSQLEKSLPKSFLSLARSCSLPAEVERSKRMVSVKELRIMRRVEAKKRVVEKKRNAKITNDQKEKLIITEGPPSSPSKVPAWAAASAAKSPALNRAIDKIKEGFRKLEGLEGSSITKVPSERIPSSKPIKAEAEPVIFSEIAASNEKYAKLNLAETNFQSPIKKAKLSKNGYIHLAGIDVMKKMPSVTTTGDGPNGRKIEGFLYKYMKGQVSIVCVCHGSFLSPEEFVKHAGRIDVTNPMKHINVCTTSFSY